MAKGIRMTSIIFVVVVAILMRNLEAQMVHIVGDEFGWKVPTGGPLTYIVWAGTQNFTVGDILVFNFTTGYDNVAQVTEEAFHSCNTSIPTVSVANTGPANITLNTAGENYFFSTFANNCKLGQKLAINVTEAASPGPPAAAPPPKSPPAPTPLRGPMNYIVGDDMGWTIPPARQGIVAYILWAANKTFLVGDTLEFKFIENTNDVAEVSETAFFTCNSTTVISNYTKSPAKIPLTTEGAHFYMCTYPNRCIVGQMLAINVTGTSKSASPPSNSAPPPYLSTGPSPSSENGTDSGSPTPPFTATAGFSITLMLSCLVAYLLY